MSLPLIRDLLVRPLLLLVACLALAACGSDEESGDGGGAAPSPGAFAAVQREARGQTVRWWMYGGDDRINGYVDDVVRPAAKRAGVTLEQVRVGDTGDAVQRVVAQKRAGRTSGGAVDLIWINGQNFAAGKEAGLWLEDWVTGLPSAKFIDFEDPSVARDFQVPIDGQEAPWSRAAFAFAYDSSKVPEPPRDFGALLAYARENPGRFTYPAPPDFTGSSFVRQVVVALGEEEAFAYLRQLKPLMYEEGRSLPKSVAELDELFANGEVDLTMSYDSNFVDAQVRRKTFPGTARPLVIGKGALTNVSYNTIPADAKNRAGALVVANLLMSPALQASKADPSVLGIDTVVDLERLAEDERAKFGAAESSPYLLKDLGQTLEELPADEVPRLEKRWTREVLRG